MNVRQLAVAANMDTENLVARAREVGWTLEPSSLLTSAMIDDLVNELDLPVRRISPTIETVERNGQQPLPVWTPAVAAAGLSLFAVVLWLLIA